MKRRLLHLLLAFFTTATMQAQVDTLTLSSQALEQSIEVYLYEMPGVREDSPVVYLTDGRKWLENGWLDHLPQTADLPVVRYVLVSTIDPAGNDRRNTYFFSNPAYLTFFENELIPAAEQQFGVTSTPAQRLLVGISFGGLNAAYFSAHAHAFERYALLSPITYPRPTVLTDIAQSAFSARRIFLSTGVNDAERYVQPLAAMYASKGYTVKTHHTTGGHDFPNWLAQWALMLEFCLAQEE